MHPSHCSFTLKSNYSVFLYFFWFFFFWFWSAFGAFCSSGGKRVFRCSHAAARYCIGECKNMSGVLQRLTEFHDFSSFWSYQGFMTLWSYKLVASPCEERKTGPKLLASPHEQPKSSREDSQLARNLRETCEPVRKEQPWAVWFALVSRRLRCVANKTNFEFGDATVRHQPTRHLFCITLTDRASCT